MYGLILGNSCWLWNDFYKSPLLRYHMMAYKCHPDIEIITRQFKLLSRLIMSGRGLDDKSYRDHWSWYCSEVPSRCQHHYTTFSQWKSTSMPWIYYYRPRNPDSNCYKTCKSTYRLSVFKSCVMLTSKWYFRAVSQLVVAIIWFPEVEIVSWLLITSRLKSLRCCVISVSGWHLYATKVSFVFLGKTMTLLKLTVLQDSKYQLSTHIFYK